ncbi:hypothetical protein XSR1_10295 [Xenorhabdus szentirmaii DSM 16338]|uniref:Uncharacterized protein n=1 Tax=Xenorhabdus szentirmaii DSM 16338 TaxID=1427518 RepID=W1ISP0_9GAMM|nr:hypothetical protein XSR1_10295 [Xenorhabdus szentirmaii DSM 16338]
MLQPMRKKLNNKHKYLTPTTIPLLSNYVDSGRLINHTPNKIKRIPTVFNNEIVSLNQGNNAAIK